MNYRDLHTEDEIRAAQAEGLLVECRHPSYSSGWEPLAVSPHDLSGGWQFRAVVPEPVVPDAPAAPATPDELAAYNAWFASKQGTPYDGAWEFARDAWMARAGRAAPPDSAGAESAPNLGDGEWYGNGSGLPALHDDPATNREIQVQALCARLDTARQALGMVSDLRLADPHNDRIRKQAQWALSETAPGRVLPRSVGYNEPTPDSAGAVATVLSAQGGGGYMDLHVRVASGIAFPAGTKFYTHPAPAPSDSYLRAVDDELVVAHIGTAEPTDDLATAKRKLALLIDWSIKVATDPRVNGGRELVPSDTLATLTAERDNAILHARGHAQEARAANHTISEIYQICTGSTGEPGNWNGSEPVRKLAADRDALRAEVERLRADAARYRWLRMNRLWLKANLPMIAAQEFDTAIDTDIRARTQGETR